MLALLLRNFFFMKVFSYMVVYREGTSKCVLYREVIIISALWGLKCTSIIEKGPQSVSYNREVIHFLGVKMT